MLIAQEIPVLPRAPFPISNEPRANWLCLHTEPRREEFAASNLIAAGFHVYLPRYERWIRHARRQIRVIRPLFSRYLFICPGLGQAPVGLAGRCRGVVALVGERTSGSIVPHGVIASLRAHENETGCIELNPNRFKSGQGVRLMGGPFAGFEAIFDVMDDRQRALVLVKFLGKAHRIKVPAGELEPAV